MAFLGKLMKKKSSEEELDEDEKLLDLSLSSKPETDAEEKKDLSKYRVSTIKLEREADSVKKPSEDGKTEAAPEGPGEGKGISSIDPLMGIFEEETAVDQRLLALASWVEEIEAEELAEDLRSLMDELQKN